MFLLVLYAFEACIGCVHTRLWYVCNVPRRISTHTKQIRSVLVRCAVCAGVGTLLALPGCGMPVTGVNRPHASRAVGWQGGAAEAVLPGATLDRATMAWASPTANEYGRRDGLMNIKPNEPLLASNEWPEPERPTIRSQRRLNLDDARSRSFIFVLPERGYDRYDGWYPRRGYGSRSQPSWHRRY